MIFSGKELNRSIQILLSVLFIGFAIANAYFDYKLCALRRAGDQGYQVPHGLLFEYVSGPHYLFELLEWLSYIFFFPFGFGFATAGIWLLAAITGRAESNHDAYLKKNILPKNVKYPTGRAPYIPFIENSKYLI
ncbi:3-oxo-5-alpha-steroid 4-dehydrogenase [Histomonas meleagridis]|uniref:3-oxo-5-alpha-steroid 4-dehydrogenase n=1 Tax=Histomonas meleagridis TaxID=135588 RepID=UPI003559ACCD|nr:3-oxo-5-alpha-steroid 4-dehydrogenase [Histomonas meleagridis]KAH0797152.1 3-oxo-5-alpha-steroid 4-dehydrogenase [Histomonas meleagridis]